MPTAQGASSLDPKLKEAYDRVMNTPTNQVPPANPQAPSVQAAVQPPQVNQQTAPAQNTVVQPAPTISSSQPQAKIIVAASNGKARITKILFIVLGVVFFAIYALFWLRYFNIATPF